MARQAPPSPSNVAPGADDLRVLVVHNRYRSGLPSGENRVVDREIALLRDAGVHVATWLRSSDEIDEMSLLERAGLALRPIWSRRDTAGVAAIIDTERPHVLHLHNPYPLVSPGVIRTAKRRGVAVVQTVHNYRHSCLNGLHLRDGAVCTACQGRRVAWPGVRHGCYRSSRPQSAVLATAEALHHPTWRLVDRFLALSPFMADQLAASGIPRERIAVKPNFVDDPGPPSPPGSGFLFAGRLEEAKGVLLLLDAWDVSGLDGTVPLVLAGDGPLRAEVERRAAGFRSVEVTGPLGSEQLAARYRACAAVVVPSLCFEGPPTVALEALAHGRPLVVTRIGALTDLAEGGWGWSSPLDPLALATTLRRAHVPDAERSRTARQEFEERFSARPARDEMFRAYSAVCNLRPWTETWV